MAYEYDRFEREEGGGSFLMGLLAGTVLGAGLGMLFAPKTGSELRSQLGNQLADQTGRLREVADQGYQQATEKVSQMMDRGREAYDRARTNVGNMARGGHHGIDPEPGRHDQHVGRRDVGFEQLRFRRFAGRRLRQLAIDDGTASAEGGGRSHCRRGPRGRDCRAAFAETAPDGLAARAAVHRRAAGRLDRNDSPSGVGRERHT